MSDYENEDECWSALEGFRVKLISIIDPARITPYLRQCKVLNPDDEEQVLSDPSLVIRKRKVGQCPCPTPSPGGPLPCLPAAVVLHAQLRPRESRPDPHHCSLLGFCSLACPHVSSGSQVCSWTSCSGLATRATWRS